MTTPRKSDLLPTLAPERATEPDHEAAESNWIILILGLSLLVMLCLGAWVVLDALHVWFGGEL